MSDENSKEKMGLAGFFNGVREVIESAETPFAKLAIFILPILSPLVPASMTGLHLYKLFLEMFTFTRADIFAGVVATIAATVLEILGYVGAISFVQSLFKWVKTREDRYMIPTTLNFLAYLFYLICMYYINVQLGRYFGVSDIVNTIVGWLSFITVPTSLLAANHLNQREESDEEYVLRQEERQDKIELARIRANAKAQLQERQPHTPPAPPVAEQPVLPTDWRKRRRKMTSVDVETIAQLTKDERLDYAKRNNVTEKTVENWGRYAQLEILDRFIKENKTFPSDEMLRNTILSTKDIATYIVKNQDYLTSEGILSSEFVEKARAKL